MPLPHPVSSIQDRSPSPWPALESSRGLLSVPVCWRARLGEHYDAFRAAFLTQSSQPAKYYPCARGCGCMHEIVKAPNTKLQAPEKLQTSSIEDEDENENEDERNTQYGARNTLHAPTLSHSTSLLAACRCSEPHCPD